MDLNSTALHSPLKKDSGHEKDEQADQNNPRHATINTTYRPITRNCTESSNSPSFVAVSSHNFSIFFVYCRKNEYRKTAFGRGKLNETKNHTSVHEQWGIGARRIIACRLPTQHIERGRG
jgi:hypothetical protein